MDKDLKEQLARSIFRFKKIGVAFPADLDIHMGELFVMKKIEKSDFGSDSKVSAADIQKKLLITKPAISQIYNTLEKKGYIHRDIDKNDRRKLIVKLTPEGRVVLKRVEQFFDKRLSDAIARFGKENMVQLIELFNRFADISEELNETINEHVEGDDSID